MEDATEKQDFVDGDPFGTLLELTKELLSPPQIVSLIETSSIEELYEKLRELIGDKSAEKIIETIEATRDFSTSPKPAVTELEWAFIQRFNSIVSPHIVEMTQRGQLLQLRTMAVHTWSVNMASLREMLRSDTLAPGDEETFNHALRHLLDAMFAMTVIILAFRVSQKDLKARFFKADPEVIDACKHERATYTLMRFLMGNDDGWDAEILLDVIVCDLAGLAGLMTELFGGVVLEVAEFEVFWDRVRDHHYTFPHAVKE